MPINKKRKLGLKTVDCIFLRYAHHSIAYRFLVFKSEVPDVHVNSLMESRDVTFFENIFPMKDLHSMSRLSSDVIAEKLLNLVHFQIMLNKHLNQSMRRLIVKLLGGARDKGL